MTKKLLTVAALTVLLSPAVLLAQGNPPAQDARRDPGLPVVPFGNLGKASDEDIARSRRVAEEMARSMEQGFAAPVNQEVVRLGQDLRRRADDIADEAIAGERAEVLRFLGLNPESDTALYYFVSWSMPLELLRSYAVEAMWSGGTLVFKGVPPGREIGKYLVEDLRKLVYSKGAAANVSLDPRLFDAYGVKVVPTLVFTTTRDNLQCGEESATVKINGVPASYGKCPPISADKYWKLSGNVTTSHALEQFVANGADQAKPYLQAIAKGWEGRPKPGKDQVPFQGKWEDVLSPSQQAAAQQAAKELARKGGASAPERTKR